MSEGRPIPSPPGVTVVVINWNQSAATRACLARLTRWTRVRPAVWVVDNASSDNRLDGVAADFPDVKLLASDTNLGFGGGNNLALREVAGDHVLLLNNDAEIDEDSVLSMLEALEREPRLALVGPLLTRDGSDEIFAAGGRDIGRYVRTHLSAPLDRDRPYEVDYVPGTAVLLRAGLLDEVGLLDDAYFFGGEMADLCERARSRGYAAAIVPQATASHDTEQAAGLRRTLYPYYILRNRFLFIRKFQRRRLVPLFAFWGAYGAYSALRALLRGDRGGARLAALAVADGLAGRFGGQNDRVLR